MRARRRGGALAAMVLAAVLTTAGLGAGGAGAAAAPPAGASAVLSPPRSYRPCPAPDRGARTVALDGDSLAFYAAADFTARLCRSSVAVQVVGQAGAALCDFAPLLTDQARHPPAVLVLAFSGNNVTPCMADSTGTPLRGAALLAKYRADAERVTAAFAGTPTRLLWVSPPGHAGDTVEPALRAVYQEVVDEHPTRGSLVDGGRYLREGNGLYPYALPCAPDERRLASCRAGRIEVRLGLDGFHFCPVFVDAGVSCPVDDAGGIRYARAMAAPVAALLRLRDGPTLRTR